VRIKRSAQPLPSGARTKAGELSMPHHALGLEPAGCSDRMLGCREDRMAEAGTHIFRVTLREEPSVYRDIEIDSGKSLAKLAEASSGPSTSSSTTPSASTATRKAGR
jgi:hypothetical protein